jgi:type I restriction enzyme S subunit
LKDVTQSADLLGAVSRVPRQIAEGRLTQDTVKLIPKTKDVPTDYLYWLLRTPQYRSYCRSHATGTTNLGLSRADFLAFPVPEPSHQRLLMVRLFQALDDKIELNRRMNETLEAMARAIFKSWFVDFDSVRAKAEGRDAGLPKPIVDLFPDSFEDSELGRIPRGWRVGTVDEVANINTRTLGRQDSLDIIDYIEISEVMCGDVATVSRYQRGEEPSRARRRLQHGDTALSTVRPDRGAFFLCLAPPETLVASTGFAVLTPKDGNWAFLHTMVTRKEVGEELGRLADGGAYPAIRPEVVGGLPAVLPDDARLVTVFDELAQPLYLRAGENRSESRILAVLRDALLPKLLSGRLRCDRKVSEEVK